MKTRSQTKQESFQLEYNFVIDIDFDSASEAWKANKKSIGNGSYKYVCSTICKSNNRCNRTPVMNENFCKTHLYIQNTKNSKNK